LVWLGRVLDDGPGVVDVGGGGAARSELVEGLSGVVEGLGVLVGGWGQLVLEVMVGFGRGDCARVLGGDVGEDLAAEGVEVVGCGRDGAFEGRRRWGAFMADGVEERRGLVGVAWG